METFEEWFDKNWNALWDEYAGSDDQVPGDEEEYTGYMEDNRDRFETWAKKEWEKENEHD